MSETKTVTPLLSDVAYDRLRAFTQLILPALGTLYFAVAQITGLPFGQEVLGIIAAVTTFLGVILGVSRKSYNQADDGLLVVDETAEDTDYYRFEVDNLVGLKDKETLKIRVQNNTTPGS